MPLIIKSQFSLWRRSFYLACVLYGASWLLGIVMTATFVPQSVIQQVHIAPVITHDAWYYISHNVGVEGVLLLGAFTFGIGTGLVLCLNGLFDGMIVTAIAQRYGLGVVLAGLLPHGLFEMCAWILISTCGFLLSSRFKRVVASLWSTGGAGASKLVVNEPVETLVETKRMKLANRGRDVYLALIIVSTLLLVVAGIIEASISPMLISNV